MILKTRKRINDRGGMLKIGFETWPYILKNCEKIFEEEPILEGAMGLTCKFVIRRKGKPAPIFFVMKWAIPFWRIIKKNFHITGTFKSQIISEKNQIENIINKDVEVKTYCIFSVNIAMENYFNCVFPIMKKIDKIGENSILFTKYNIYSEKKKEIESLKNNSVIFTENLIYNLTSFEIIKCFIHAHKLFKKLLRETKNDEIIKFVKKHKNEIISRIEEILVFSEAISKIIKNKKCKFCLSLGGYFSLINACKRYGIKTAMMQHGNFGNVEDHIEYTVQPPECSPHADDEIIVWGEYSKDKVKHLYSYGSDRKIVVLGNPRYDEIIEKYLNKKRSQDFYNKLNLDSKKKTVVFFSSSHAIDMYGHEFIERHIEPIYSLDQLYEKLNSKINLIIKLHPQETKKYYKKYMKNVDNVTIIKNEIPPYELYQYTDIAMTVSSTTLLEAMIFEIPTLQLILTKYGTRGENYYKHGAAILIRNSDELIDTVEKNITKKYDLSELKKDQKKYLEKNLANLGYATNKIVEHLLRGQELG